jgi:hypothetical protein
MGSQARPIAAAQDGLPAGSRRRRLCAKVSFPFLGLPCYPYELLEKRMPAKRQAQLSTSGDTSWQLSEPCPS